MTRREAVAYIVGGLTGWLAAKLGHWGAHRIAPQPSSSDPCTVGPWCPSETPPVGRLFSVNWLDGGKP